MKIEMQQEDFKPVSFTVTSREELLIFLAIFGMAGRVAATLVEDDNDAMITLIEQPWLADSDKRTVVTVKHIERIIDDMCDSQTWFKLYGNVTNG